MRYLCLAPQALAVLALAAAGGCGNDAPSEPDAIPVPPDANPLCLEAMDHSDLAWIQENILTPSCSAFDACHKDRADEAGGLNLEAGMSHAQLVGVQSEMFPEFDRVVAGDPESSYLMVILGHVDGPIDEDVGTMPYNSPLLCVEMRDAIARWIEAGAPANP